MAMTVDTGADAGDPRIERSRRVVREAALAELAEAGYGGFTIESVSLRCGVARSTIYRHWPGKLALLRDALETLDRQPASADAPDDEAPLERIHRLVRHLAEAFQDSTLSNCVPALIEGAERHREIRDFHHQFNARRRKALVDAVARGVETGDLPAHVDPDISAIAIAGAIVYRRVMTGEAFDPDRSDELIRTVLHPNR